MKIIYGSDTETGRIEREVPEVRDAQAQAQAPMVERPAPAQADPDRPDVKYLPSPGKW